MSFNLFRGQVDDEFDKKYEKLDDKDKLTVDLYGILVINHTENKINFDIKHEIIFDKDTKQFTARYIVDVPLSYIPRKNSRNDIPN